MGSLKSFQCKDFKSFGNYLTIPKVNLGSGNDNSYTSPKGRTDRTYYSSCYSFNTVTNILFLSVTSGHLCDSQVITSCDSQV